MQQQLLMVVWISFRLFEQMTLGSGLMSLHALQQPSTAICLSYSGSAVRPLDRNHHGQKAPLVLQLLKGMQACSFGSWTSSRLATSINATQGDGL